MICFPFLRHFGAPDVFFPGAPACNWNRMAHLSSFSPSIWRPWRFLSWSPCLHLKLHGAPLVLFSVNLAPLTFFPWSPCFHLKLHGASLVPFSVNLAPLTFSFLEPLLALETAWRPSRPFLRQFGAPDVFSLEPLLSLETAWRISRPFLRQFGAPDVFFPGAPACTWNCMAPLSSFSPSIWRPWRFLPWNPPLLALKTAWRPSRPFLRQFGAPDVFFPGAPACTLKCMVPLSSFSPSIWRPWHFLPWSPCLYLKLYGAPLVLFSVNLAPLTFSSLEPPCLHLKLHGAPLVLFLRQVGAPDVFFPGTPACTWNCMAPHSSYWFNFLSFFFLSCSFFLPFFFLFPFFSSCFLFSPLFLSLSFFLSFWRPFGDPGGPWPPKPPKIRPCFSYGYLIKIHQGN